MPYASRNCADFAYFSIELIEPKPYQYYHLTLENCFNLYPMVTHTYYKLRVVDFVAVDYKQIGVGDEVKSTLLFFGAISAIYIVQKHN